MKSLTVEDCEQSKCEVDPVKFAQTLAAKGGGQELRLVTLSPSTLLQSFVLSLPLAGQLTGMTTVQEAVQVKGVLLVLTILVSIDNSQLSSSSSSD